MDPTTPNNPRTHNYTRYQAILQQWIWIYNQGYVTAIIDCNCDPNHLAIRSIIKGMHPTQNIHYADPNLHNKLTNYITNLNHLHHTYPRLNHCTERREEETLQQ